jgi:hypothetical protein
MSLRLSPLTLLIALLCGAGGTVFAADAGQLPETVNRIERETGARVLSAQRSQRGGREVNRIKVLTPDGRVRVMWDDPQRERAAAASLRREERDRRPAMDLPRPPAGDPQPAAGRDD